ncbi:hypothetical protein [uncultured Methanobrevibacter sp.]|uniref:hypothetical protein n=1 Tax=uncultured Methanobrevibacter sp. TaxID=253161 RepID=UPI0025FC3040|nr:hypothetical protein [uncultured Methanobrevibacter sp.]
MENKHLIIIGVLIIIIVILAVGIMIISNPNGGGSNSLNLGMDSNSMGKTVIKVTSDNNAISGKMEVFEFRNVKQNANGTWNLSEFGDYYGLLGFYSDNNGAEHDVMIKNGTAEYEIKNDTQVFFVYYYITDISGKGNITVDLNVNGAQKFSSISEIYSKQCDINWGDQLITRDGNVISDNDLIPDTPHNKFVTK